QGQNPPVETAPGPSGTPQNGVPPQPNAYPPQQPNAYPPQQPNGGPQQGQYPGQQAGSFPPQQPNAYPPQGQYPPQQGGSYPPVYGRPPYQQPYPPQYTQQPYVLQKGGDAVVVPSGSALRVRINQGMSSKDAAPGMAFDGVVLSDVIAGGSIAIPRGA